MEDSYLYTPIFIAVFTGLRIGELCGLRWCDVDFETKYLSVTNQVINDEVQKD